MMYEYRDSMDILDEENFESEQVVTLANNDIVIFRNYQRIVDQYLYYGNRFSIVRNGDIIFHLDTPIDKGCLICSDIIDHRDGNQYLLFRTQLYGYSVLNLNSLEIRHYVPSLGVDEESFIWCEAVYCASNNLLYVSGCYWAYPGSTLVVDFSNPMEMPFREYDLTNEVTDFYEDIDPVRWEDNGSLTYKIGKHTYTLSEQRILSLLDDISK